jgi:hypothetical protein
VAVEGLVGPLAPPDDCRQENGGWRDPDERRCWAAFFRGDDLDATVYEQSACDTQAGVCDGGGDGGRT